MEQRVESANQVAGSMPVIPGGEIRGSMLIGLVRSFDHVRAVSREIVVDLLDGTDSNGWYPMSSFFRLLDLVCKDGVDCGPLLFHAGMAVADDWYENGGGRSRVSCAAEFLRLQGGSGGYAQVHRGEPDEIGWMDLVEFDEHAGRAVIVCVTPYPKEFERGVLYGGTLHAGDVQFVHVESEEEPYNAHLTRKTLTIRFCRQPDTEVCRQVDTLLADMLPDKPIALSPSVFEAIVWRLKSVEARYQLERSFHQQSNLLLSKAIGEIHDLSRKLDDLAHHDELTGLINRRAVMRRAESLLALSGRHGWPVSFVMIDIDHFKSINDEWGHAVGDEALRVVAFVLRERLRDSDLLGRIGGEEFLAVLHGSDMDGARTVAESLRVAVENQLLLSPGKQRIPLTISLGVAVADDQGADVANCIEEADQALYRSKRNGRNLVTCFTH